MKFYVIGDEATVAGFGLVGVDGVVVQGSEEAKEALEQAFSSNDIGIIIITEKIAAAIREEMEEYVFSHDFPLVIEIPGREGPMEGRVSIRQMVRSAIGFSV